MVPKLFVFYFILIFFYFLFIYFSFSRPANARVLYKIKKDFFFGEYQIPTCIFHLVS